MYTAFWYWNNWRIQTIRYVVELKAIQLIAVYVGRARTVVGRYDFVTHCPNLQWPLKGCACRLYRLLSESRNTFRNTLVVMIATWCDTLRYEQ